MNSYDFEKAREFFRAKTAFTTGVHELEVLINSRKNPDSWQVVDVRYPSDFAEARVPGAINLPKGKWKDAKGLRKDATIFLYCYTQTCHLAAEAGAELSAQGYQVVEVEGGWETWVKNGYTVEKTAKSA
ncbi:MAG TPA: rhodanese-like domain-containing protein [Gammaproteobacteria bacterium]